jgi:N-acetylmuramoyl-L-alanine amidase
MSLPALRSGNTFLLPFRFVTALIPRYASGFFYDNAARELRIFTTVARHYPEPRQCQRQAMSFPNARRKRSVRRSSPSIAQRRTAISRGGRCRPWRARQWNDGPIGGGPRLVEKNITLAVARLLAQELRGSGVDVLMTRTTDTLIACPTAVESPIETKGDLFVSIHVNATGITRALCARERGFETYFLAEAKSEDALRVEKMENEAVRFETGAYAPEGRSAQLHHQRHGAERASARIERSCRNDSAGLENISSRAEQGVQQANFAVLRGSYMPAVLVEIGFGTNPDEAEYLERSRISAKSPRALRARLLDYIRHYEARVGGGTQYDGELPLAVSFASLEFQNPILLACWDCAVRSRAVRCDGCSIRSGGIVTKAVSPESATWSARAARRGFRRRDDQRCRSRQSRVGNGSRPGAALACRDSVKKARVIVNVVG